MNQAEMIAAIYRTSEGTSKTAIKAILDAQADITHAELANGNEVTLAGLGKLSASKRDARIGRNPRTGEAVQIEARKTPKFHAAKALKDALNG